MPRIRYELTTELNDNPDMGKGEYGISAYIKDGVVHVIAEYDDDDEDLLTSADASGDRQADMLWEIFDHGFEVFDADGNVVEYED